MKQKRFWLKCSFVLLVALLLFTVFRVTTRTVIGNCVNLKELPHFGNALPSVNVDNLEFEYEPMSGVLQARGYTDIETVEELIRILALDTVKYESGFPGLGVTRDSAFLPSKSRVWCAFGLLHGEGRVQIWLLYEPPVTPQITGRLFIHIT